MIEYPNKLNKIFDKLYNYSIKSIIVGGYIRDFLLKKQSKDIDIELYGVTSLKEVETILQEFGDVNSVGKSFGVLKLNYCSLELDFSLPRKENKTNKGHKGFRVELQNTLDFKTAASRRDFTINAIGYDVKEKKLLDPFYGKRDLEHKILKAVDIERFDEDPLRVLRVVQFAARFELRINTELFKKSQSMLQNNVLEELPKERIFTEFEKLFLKAKKPSIGLQLFKELGGFLYFTEFSQLKTQDYDTLLKGVDIIRSYNLEDEKITLTLIFSLLISKFSNEQQLSFLDKLTNNKKLKENALHIARIKFNINSFDNYKIYKLAKKVNISTYSNFLKAKYLDFEGENIQKLLKHAERLGVKEKPLKALIKGQDLINTGLRPSKNFSQILQTLYELQMEGKIKTKSDALEWVRKNQKRI